MQRFFPALVGLIILLAIASSCVFIVRERAAALVFTLEELPRTINEPVLYS